MDKFETGSGNLIYRLPVTAFPGMEVNVYVVIAGDFRVLIDSGSGYGQANEQIVEGLREISHDLGQTFDLSTITHVFITHAHIDHFGGLPFILENSSALLGVHILDRRILANYEETLTVVTHKLSCFFQEAGVAPERHSDLLGLYRFYKVLFHSVRVDFTYGNGNMRYGPFDFLHVPGHTAGHVLIRVDECVFSGDHILQDISPHQAPEQITLNTGLEHYLASLDKALGWLEPARVVFPGHDKPLEQPAKMVERIRKVHQERLRRVLAICESPKTIVDISSELFSQANGYHELLALEETGAHVEYLYQYGWLGIDNLADLENNERNSAIYYRASFEPEVIKDLGGHLSK